MASFGTSLIPTPQQIKPSTKSEPSAGWRD
jgi:hypothetical protein